MNHRVDNLLTSEQRLWDSLMDMARYGATPKGGNCRLALSDEDRQGRDAFVGWCKAAGCAVTVDSLGNIFARRSGQDPNRAPVAAGSHLDTQPHGGKFDGVYGVLAGLEIVRTLNDHDIRTEAPIEVVVWTNEEGSRFAPSMMASGVFAGAYKTDLILGVADREGITVGAELKRIGYAGNERCGDHPIGTMFEAHIEQGPILEAEGKTIGVVTGVQGVAWFDITVTGQDTHAGSTPMDRRYDALLGAARMIDAVNAIALSHQPSGRATVGEMGVSPNSRNTVPGEVYFTVDMRDPLAATMTAMEKEMEQRCEAIAAGEGLKARVDKVSYTPPVVFDDDCITAVRKACEQLDLPHRDMLSGAGHDACYVSRVAPTSMIFVPCEAGLSHNEEENATPQDLAAGCNVLLHAMLARAGVAN
ncbi:MAG: Zn-dependent hydrolase [Gammaproteobacteria bacterium]